MNNKQSLDPKRPVVVIKKGSISLRQTPAVVKLKSADELRKEWMGTSADPYDAVKQLFGTLPNTEVL